MITHLKTYQRFLFRNKLYTAVSLLGFSVSLMFVVLLGVYIKQENSVDDFQEKKARIFVMTHDNKTNFGNLVAAFVKEQCPEVEMFTRTLGREIATNLVGQEKMKAAGLFADPDFFNIFSYKLLEGNSNQVLQDEWTVVLGATFARKMFDDENPVGKLLIINDQYFTITGIMEDFPEKTLLPMSDFVAHYNAISMFWGTDEILKSNDNFGFTMFFLEKENADLCAKTPQLLELFKENFWFYHHGFTNDLKFVSLKEAYYAIQGTGYIGLNRNNKTIITVYTCIAILILIVSLLNYINMTVAQAGFRGKEAATRKLFGCSRQKIILQLFTESLIMTLLAFLIGLFLAFAAEPFFNDVLNTNLHLENQFTFDIIVFITFSILMISIIAGIVPALLISKFNPIEIVNGTLTRRIKTTYSKVLIIFQYTITTILLICSLFIKNQSDFLIHYDLGYQREGVFVMRNLLEDTQEEGFKSKLFSIEGVENVSFTCGTPLNGGNNMSYERDGEAISFQEFYVDSAFFDIFNIKFELLTTPTSESWYVNRIAYNILKPDTQSFMALFGGGEVPQKIHVAGILDEFHFKYKSLAQVQGPLRIHFRPEGWGSWDIVVKISPSADLYKVAQKVEDAYREYSDNPTVEGRFAEDEIQSWYEDVKKTSKIMSAFTVLTILIMIMGVFAMSLYTIRQKEKGIAIRKVHGATIREILLMLNLESLISILIAFVVACPIAYYAMSKWLESFEYKIPLSASIFLLAGVSILLLTLLSVSWLTWRAAKANPVRFLKKE
ncbi:MAG: FtsX-like permease family protein [Lentimicrobiaceae bacterium]|nr:FtsX-like permease family protein [Lentimicrobiaceae bacterium]